MSLLPILSRSSAGAVGDLKIEYRGEWLPEPTLLAVDIKNVGERAIESPPITIKAHGATYVIPGYFEDAPEGYDDLWTIERTDAEACAIHLAHLNSGQVARVRLMLDEMPSVEPLFVCPMKDIQITRVDHINPSITARALLIAIARAAVLPSSALRIP